MRFLITSNFALSLLTSDRAGELPAEADGCCGCFGGGDIIGALTGEVFAVVGVSRA